MSVEQLLDRTISSEFIKREQKLSETKHRDRSPVYIVANTYISEAQSVLKAISQELDDKHIKITSHSDFIEQIEPKKRPTFQINMAGLLMGVSLHTFEDILVEKKFDPSNLISEYNLAVTGTRLSLATAENNQATDIEDSNWRRMHEYAKEDRSLSIFFTDGLETLPTNLKNSLKNIGLLEIISDKLVPIYKKQINDYKTNTNPEPTKK